MRKKTVFVLLILFLALNIIVIATRLRKDAKWDEEARNEEIKKLRDRFRAGHLVTVHDYYPLVGALVQSGFWRGTLPLGEAQKKAITHLDRLLWDADASSLSAVADYLGGDPADYKRYVARDKERRLNVVPHAQRMVILGLLTEPQSAFVLQQYLSKARASQALGDENVRSLLGMTTQQEKALAAVRERARARNAQVKWFAVDKNQQRKNREQIALIKSNTDTALMGVLTPSQRELWSRLTAERTLPVAPPNMPALSDVKAATSDLFRISGTFRFIDAEENSLGFSAEQKRLLKELEEITCQGLLWINLAHRGGESERRSDFLRHAEHVALEGILTQQQEDKVRAAITKK